MIRYERRDVLIAKSVDVVEEVICNGCGKPLQAEPPAELTGCERCDKEKAMRRFYGLVEHTVEGGYSSSHLLDCTSYTFSLCEECFVRIMGTFVIPPAVRDLIGGGPETTTWAEDRELWNSCHQGAHSVHVQRPSTRPAHAGTCDTLYRGCAPDCPALLWDRAFAEAEGEDKPEST
jgi:hypothetical protein